MLDQEKLVKELQKRAQQYKELADKYSNPTSGDPTVCREHKARMSAYNEIVVDIRKGKFKLKEPVVTNFNKM